MSSNGLQEEVPRELKKKQKKKKNQEEEEGPVEGTSTEETQMKKKAKRKQLAEGAEPPGKNRALYTGNTLKFALLVLRLMSVF